MTTSTRALWSFGIGLLVPVLGVGAVAVAAGNDGAEPPTDVRTLTLPLGGADGAPLHDDCGKAVMVSGAELLDALAVRSVEPPRDEAANAKLQAINAEQLTAVLAEAGYRDLGARAAASPEEQAAFDAAYTERVHKALTAAGIANAPEEEVVRTDAGSRRTTDEVFGALVAEQNRANRC